MNLKKKIKISLQWPQKNTCLIESALKIRVPKWASYFGHVRKPPICADGVIDMVASQRC